MQKAWDDIEKSSESAGEDESAPTYDFSDLDYEDANYYMRDGIVYTPDYAKGTIQCVLEVPTAGIRRGVYTGTWEEINYDLDIWMVTAARPDYTLGETHMCIYGHNHTAQDLSFNRLKDVEVGDAFLSNGRIRTLYIPCNKRLCRIKRRSHKKLRRQL